MYVYNKALRNTSSKLGVYVSLSLNSSAPIDSANCTGSRSLSCSRCKENIQLDWVFCVRCGEKLSGPSVDPVVVTSSGTKPAYSSHPKRRNIKNECKSKAISIELPGHLNEKFLNLKASLLEIHHETTVTEIQKQQLRATILEVENACLLENTYADICSGEANNQSLCSSILSETVPQFKPKGRRKGAMSSCHSDVQYLNEVGSVTALYDQLIQREKLLKGLNSAVVEPLVVESSSRIDKNASWAASTCGQSNLVHSRGQSNSKLTEGAAWFWGSAMGNDSMSNDDCHGDGNYESAVLRRNITDESFLEEFSCDDGDIRESAERQDVTRNKRGGVGFLWADVLLANKPLEEGEEEVNGPALSLTAEGVVNSDAQGASPSSSAIKAAMSSMSEHHQVPASFAVISRLYSRACCGLRDAIEQGDLDFRIDYESLPTTIPEFTLHVERLDGAIEWALQADAKAKTEFELFREMCNRRRTVAAMQVSDALKDASESQAEFQQKYDVAAASFRRSCMYDSFVSSSASNMRSRLIIIFAFTMCGLLE